MPNDLLSLTIAGVLAGIFFFIWFTLQIIVLLISLIRREDMEVDEMEVEVNEREAVF